MSVSDMAIEVAYEVDNSMEDYIRHELAKEYPWLLEAYTFNIEKIAEDIRKQIPEDPVMWGDGYYDGELVMEEWECPNCGAVYEIEEQHRHCPNCGQRIKWESDEE